MLKRENCYSMELNGEIIQKQDSVPEYVYGEVTSQ